MAEAELDRQNRERDRASTEDIVKGGRGAVAVDHGMKDDHL